MRVYDDTYSVMEDGTVVNTKRNCVKKPGGTWTYLAITLHRKGHPNYYCGTLHRLVCRLFHGEPPSPSHEVDHIDRDPHNNHASNLRWVSKSENCVNRSERHRASGYKHITRIPRLKGEVFRVDIKRIRFTLTCATLEEAIAKRDEILAHAGV